MAGTDLFLVNVAVFGFHRGHKLVDIDSPTVVGVDFLQLTHTATTLSQHLAGSKTNSRSPRRRLLTARQCVVALRWRTMNLISCSVAKSPISSQTIRSSFASI